MIKLYDHVKIKSSGIRGIVIDIYGSSFTVESDEERKPGDNSGYPGRWPLYTCTIDELEPIDETTSPPASARTWQ